MSAVVLEETPRSITKDDAGEYFTMYIGLLVAKARCSICEAKYLAWVDEQGLGIECGLSNALRRPCPEEGRFFIDLSYRSTFSDEPGDADYPVYYCERTATVAAQRTGRWPRCELCERPYRWWSAKSCERHDCLAQAEKRALDMRKLGDVEWSNDNRLRSNVYHGDAAKLEEKIRVARAATKVVTPAHGVIEGVIVSSEPNTSTPVVVFTAAVTPAEAPTKPKLNGVRKNKGKPRLATLVPLGAMEAIARAGEVGLIKYWLDSYREDGGYPLSETLDSAMRHLMARASGEVFDPKTKADVGLDVDHLDLCIWNLAAACENLRLYGAAVDDTWRGPGTRGKAQHDEQLAATNKGDE